jgi:hypothetical protein
MSLLNLYLISRHFSILFFRIIKVSLCAFFVSLCVIKTKKKAYYATSFFANKTKSIVIEPSVSG